MAKYDVNNIAVSSLLASIKNGEIAIPEIQRPRERIIKAVYYITASIKRRMDAIDLSIMMAPARKDIYIVED